MSALDQSEPSEHYDCSNGILWLRSANRRDKRRSYSRFRLPLSGVPAPNGKCLWRPSSLSEEPGSYQGELYGIRANW